MIVLIDNYDSFTYNLVQYFGEMESDIRVFRNDAIDAAGVLELKPDHVVISPGPCTPSEAGNSTDIIRQVGGKAPLLGVCLGHQCIGEVFGGKVIRAQRIMHGKVSTIRHTGHALFDDVDTPFEATRYHSLIVERDSLPDVLEITADTDQHEIMALAHRELPIVGFQFHPESILTGCGKQLLKNFLALKSEV